MSKASRLRSLIVTGSLMLVTGCSDFSSSFVPSERTTNLMPEAQEGFGDAPGINKLVDEKFGNPQQLKAWMKLPIDFGGSIVTIEQITADGSGAKVKLVPAEGITLPENASTLQFVGGPAAGKSVSVSAWDSKTGEATLASMPETAPVAGDACSIDGGEILKQGRVLYMRHCSHCHGSSGDGNGPTAQYLNPRPRDYRNGVFKFTSTNDLSKVSRDDLTRILKYGIPGTYMPSFLLMKDSEIHAIVEYVRFLAIRGEYEIKLVNELTGDYSLKALESRKDDKRSDIVAELQKFLKEDMPGAATGAGDELAEQWTAADTEDAKILPSVPRVPDSPESRRKGRELYLSKTLNCADCHGIDGAGNGPQTMAYEDKSHPTTDVKYSEPGLHDAWGNLNQPRNLQTGIFRGGRRPIDVFCRIHAGIKGSAMPSFKNTPHEDIWHIVNYVLSIQFETEPGSAGVAAATTPAPAAGAE